MTMTQQRCNDGNNNIINNHNSHHKTNIKDANEDIIFIDLPHEILMNILTYLPAFDLDHGVRPTCTTLCQECSAPELWKTLCQQTGKLSAFLSTQKKKKQQQQQQEPPNDDQERVPFNVNYQQLYHHIPCVPSDFPSIAEALDHVREGGIVTLLPGIHQEPQQLVITQSVRIRAADPLQGATLVWHYYNHNDNHNNPSSQKYLAIVPPNTPAVEIRSPAMTNQHHHNMLTSGGGTIFVNLEHINIWHAAKGNDIWSGNCALYSHGEETHTRLDGCSIQSDTGRGIVLTDGASMEVTHSAIHDCAATGLYVGTANSVVQVDTCNIIRNGYGPPPNLFVAEEEEEEDNNSPDATMTSNSRSGAATPGGGVVPPGHSGVYVEAAEAELQNCLLAGNSLAGLCLVGSGTVHMGGCDVTENGSGPMVELQRPRQPQQLYDTETTTSTNLEDDDEEEEEGGGIYVSSNNYTSYHGSAHHHHGAATSAATTTSNDGINTNHGMRLGGTMRCPKTGHTMFTRNILSRA